MYHNSLNAALESENLEMNTTEVSNKIGSLSNGDTKRFQHDGRQVSIYRMNSGRYEILTYGA